MSLKFQKVSYHIISYHMIHMYVFCMRTKATNTYISIFEVIIVDTN